MEDLSNHIGFGNSVHGIRGMMSYLTTYFKTHKLESYEINQVGEGKVALLLRLKNLKTKDVEEHIVGVDARTTMVGDKHVVEEFLVAPKYPRQLARQLQDIPDRAIKFSLNIHYPIDNSIGA